MRTTLPEEYRIVRRPHPDPLKDMPPLPEHPPEFSPGIRFTTERYQEMEIDAAGFLLPEELKLILWIIKTQEFAFAWDETEKGKLSILFFDPIRIPTVEHIPWIIRNIPIPPGIFEQVIRIIKEKIASGVYEPSNSSYRSSWFCVIKKDGKSLRLVHDLQPLNAVTIRDPSTPYPAEHLAESFGARACYSTFDLFVAFDQRAIHPLSRDLTTFQTPLGPYRLTAIPMGYTNSQQIMHADVCFILQDEIPDVTLPYVDDIPVKGPRTRYEIEGNRFETLPGNPGIRRFIWEHLNDVMRVIQRLKVVGATLSGKKIVLAAAEATIVGHLCTYEGRVAEPERVRVIQEWKPCKSLTEVRAFLGTAGVLRNFIKNYAILSRGLVSLTKKDVPFAFGPEERRSFEETKKAFLACPAIRPIDYHAPRQVIFAVDSSIIGYGAVLMQVGEDGRRYPSRFLSHCWDATQRNYSQAKIELYGLFRALHDARLFLIGVVDLVVEVDAKYIKGMINNPDLQPNATINRWIAGILLFSFKLVHVPAARHTGPDGLSRRPPSGDETDFGEISEEWLDRTYAFYVESFTVDEDDPEMPRSDKADRTDVKLLKVKHFLTNPARPEDMSDNDFRHFVKFATQFFVRNAELWRKNRNGLHQQVPLPDCRYALVRAAHDYLGHKGVYSVRLRLQDRFWWPGMTEDVKWFVRTCHECQIRQLTKVLIPPTVAIPAPLFQRVHIDVMHMPPSGGMKYIVQARCSLTGWMEFRALRTTKTESLSRFIYEDLFCRWGAIPEIITDNGSDIAGAAAAAAERAHCRHITISPYNSRANGIVERSHRDFREAIIKLCEGDENKWSLHVHTAAWAERITIQRRTGHSPYFMVHGVEPLTPLDFVENTYLTPDLDRKVTTAELLAARARALQRRPEDLEIIHKAVLKARMKSAEEFERKFAHTVRDYKFTPGNLVLVRNTRIEKELNRKSKPRYLGPYVVVRQTKGGSYILSELNGAISATRYAKFRVIPYKARIRMTEAIEEVVSRGTAELDRLAENDSETDWWDPGALTDAESDEEQES